MDRADQIRLEIINSFDSGQYVYDFAPLMKAQGPVEIIEVKANGSNRSQLALSAIVAKTTKRNPSYIHQWILQILTSKEYACSMVELVHISCGFESFMDQVTELSYVACHPEADAGDHLIIRLLLWISPENQPVQKFRLRRA